MTPATRPVVTVDAALHGRLLDLFHAASKAMRFLRGKELNRAVDAMEWEVDRVVRDIEAMVAERHGGEVGG